MSRSNQKTKNADDLAISQIAEQCSDGSEESAELAFRLIRGIQRGTIDPYLCTDPEQLKAYLAKAKRNYEIELYRKADRRREQRIVVELQSKTTKSEPVGMDFLRVCIRQYILAKLPSLLITNAVWGVKFRSLVNQSGKYCPPIEDRPYPLLGNKSRVESQIQFERQEFSEAYLDYSRLFGDRNNHPNAVEEKYFYIDQTIAKMRILFIEHAKHW